METEQRLKGDLLEELINNKEAKAEDIHARLAILGYDIREPHYVIHFEMKEKNKERASSLNSDYLKIYNKFTDIFKFVINRNGPTALMLPKLDTVQAIISKKYIDAEHMTVKKFGERLLRELGGNNHKVYIGISEETSTLSDFYQKAVEAKKAVELAKVRSSDSKVVLASELGHLTLFLNARAPEELEAFAIGKLQSLLDYDEKKNADLLLTLFYYSQNEFNLHKTARGMTISISGMRYRLQKIEDLLNIDLSNSNDRFEIQLALQILLLLGKINL
ncbi:helix-turn-helix domain-containing protein [Neobacillus drentensis]|uniref:PucR family transcriptional regulator n=1 Tax=Neobacillus drentensis TaxID=220684 RepID=UPI001F35A34A|nr:helix-turn-helix domain-containing protein [Neobacillus drentensis]ULT58014.1 helix-turn-helix domain-containing protein [Neobacillus drentensis]